MGRSERDDQAKAVPDPLAVSYRIRTVHIAVYVTYMAIALMAVLPFLPGHAAAARLPYIALCVLAVAGGTIFGFRIDWPALFAAGWGERTLYAWSALDILLVTLMCATAGGPMSEVALLYTLTTVFFAASYPSKGQICLFLFTCLSYLTLVLAWSHPVSTAAVVTRLAVFAMVWFMAAFLARERTAEMAAHFEARGLAEHRADLLSAVARAASDIATLDADDAIGGVVDSLVGVGFDVVSFCLLEDGGRRFRHLHPRGLPDSITSSPQSSGVGMVALVQERRGTVILEDYAMHPLAVPYMVRSGISSAVAAPVWVDETLQGVLVAGSLTVRALPTSDLEVFEILAAHTGRALENAGRFQQEHEATARAQEESLRDELTGLGNRRHANHLLATLRPGDAIVLIDLDHFKAVNDAHGHAGGDGVLVALAAHLRAEVRGGDDVARFGGEEFLVVLRQVGADALVATERLFDGWRQTKPMASFSAGVAVHSGDHPPDISVGRADAALYAAKTLGRDRACRYGPELEGFPAPGLS